MKQKGHKLLKRPDDFGILFATWILACNDENPVIIYEGLRHRLDLEDRYPIKELVESHGELFRIGLPKHRLENLKQQFLGGKKLPPWMVREYDDTKRNEMIESLSSEDVFRSQFRVDEEAPKSSLDIIEWGLKHIDRLRKASLEARAETAKSWEIRLVFVFALLNFIATVVLGFLMYHKTPLN